MSDGIKLKDLIPVVWTSCDVFFDKKDNEYYAIVEINDVKYCFIKDTFKEVD